MKSQSSIKDTFRVIVAKDIARTAVVGTLASPSSLADGETVVTDAGNFILDTTTVLLADRIKLVQGRGANNPLFETAPLTLDEVYQYEGQEYAAAQQQVTYVGYDAVNNSGSFEVLNNNAYAMFTTFQELSVPGNQGTYQPMSTWHQSDATATQAKVVNGLYAKMVKQIAKFPIAPIIAERVSSTSASTAVAQTATVAKGSKTVTMSAGTIFAAGDYIRFGLTTVVNAPIYKVTVSANAGATLTLDVPYQADDATGVAVSELTAVQIAAGDLGIKVTGILQPFSLDSRPVDKVQFKIGIQNSLNAASGTPVSTTQISTYGHGTEALIITQQADSSRNAGDFYGYAIFPYKQPLLTVVSGQNYSTLNVGTKALRGGNGNLTPNYQIANIQITCALDGNVANTFDTNIIGVSGIASVIDSFVTQNTNFTSQIPNL